MSAPTDRPVPNAVSFDLEHWHSATLVSGAVEDPTDRIETSTDIVLDLLDRHDVRATFFVVGRVAADYPDVVRRVSDAGHEIASHGYTHTPLFDLSPRTFERELDRTAAAIQRATGAAPDGFRAPNFSVTRETAWALPVLERRGYSYDSSVFPVGTPMYGVPGAPIRPYCVSGADEFAESAPSGGGIVELPVSVAGSRLRFPVAGGFYARLLPAWFLERCVRRLRRRGVPVHLYFHPWEFNPDVPVTSPSLPRRFVSFHGIEGMVAKLDRLLSAFEWGRTERLVGEAGASDPDPAAGAEASQANTS